MKVKVRKTKTLTFTYDEVKEGKIDEIVNTESEKLALEGKKVITFCPDRTLGYNPILLIRTIVYEEDVDFLSESDIEVEVEEVEE